MAEIPTSVSQISNEVFDFCKTLQVNSSSIPDKGKSGVYVIYNVETNRVYIGKSAGLRARLLTHFSLLKSGDHIVTEMQNDWDLFGKDSFAFAIYKLAPVSEIDDIERNLIDICSGPNCYNRFAGRKALDGAKPTKMMQIRLEPHQHEKLKRLGGSVWLRSRINEAKEPDNG